MLLSLLIFLITTVLDHGFQETQSVQMTAADGLSVFGELYYDIENTKPMVVLFHQAGSNAKAEYATIIPVLIKNEYNVLAIDQRKGGSRLGGTNRTAAQVNESELSYCDAYPDLVAALEFAFKRSKKEVIIWGSSYSAALVFRLAAEYPVKVGGVLAFSPASGAPMGNCSPKNFIDDLKAPTVAFRPGSEASIKSVKSQMELFKSHGIQTHVVPNGVHGSSMLNPDRVQASVDETWEIVLEFLKKVSR